MKVPVTNDYLRIGGSNSFLLAGCVLEPFILFIETSSDEYCQALETGDIVVVSAPEGGDLKQAVMLLELVRKYHIPLVVLPKGHPGSGRLNMVVSAGDHIQLNCGIQRGTHPEQHLICSSEELAGLEITGDGEAIVLSNIPPGVTTRVIHAWNRRDHPDIV